MYVSSYYYILPSYCDIWFLILSLQVACLTSGDRPVVRVQQQAPAGGRKREAIVTDFELDQVFMHDATQASITHTHKHTHTHAYVCLL